MFHMMFDWLPITDEDFRELLDAQSSVLDADETRLFASFRVTPWKATLRRSDNYGDEKAWVVAECGEGVLFFDDVEYGFNISNVDESGRILQPGGSQNSLQEAIRQWMIPGH